MNYKNKAKNILLGSIENALFIGFLIMPFFSFSTVYGQKPIDSLKNYREMRLEKLNHPRRVIHNNDGGDAYFFLKGTEFSIPHFLDIRTSGLLCTDVTTISYCSQASSFGQFTHNTKAGEFLIAEHNQNIRWNATPGFVKLGTDPLEVTEKFAYEHGFEFFWSNRMNDTHDWPHRPNKPYYRWSKLKESHPEYLFGAIGEKVPYGVWSAVDYSHQEIRDLCVQYYTEVCENYDVDGIELDFFRHLYLFKDVGWGKEASVEQLNMLTDMVAQIRAMTERVGMKKGKPILVLVRVPDSSEYCKAVGIDIESWMQKGLVDIVAGSGYFRLNMWNKLVEMCAGYGVKAYAGLSEPRVYGEHPLLVRRSNPVYRARCAAAWQAGVDGLYIFNEYHTRAEYLSEIGTPDKLKNMNNMYFVTYRNGAPDAYGGVNTYLKNGKRYESIPALTPKSPIEITSQSLDLPIELGDESTPGRVALILYSKKGKAESIKAALNGNNLEYVKSTDDGLIIFEVPHSLVLQGINKLSLSYGQKKQSMELLDAALLFYRNPYDANTDRIAAVCFK